MDQRVGCTHSDPPAGGVCAGRVPLCEDKSAHLLSVWDMAFPSSSFCGRTY